jgi:cation diffusion facilitator family transporter
MSGNHTHGDTPERGGARYSDIRRVTVIVALLNLVLGVMKVLAGWLFHSQSLLADGVHSLSDLATDAMVLFAAKHGSREADEEHPYGHGRIETLATVALGVALILVAIGIGWDAGARLFQPEALLHPGMGAIVVVLISIVAKEWSFHFTMRLAKRLNSPMLRANAWHHRSDSISSVVVLVGVVGTMAGLPYLDAVAAVVVAFMVARIGWELAWHSVHELVDTALEKERVEAIREEILAVDGVQAVHTLRTRRMGGGALVDVHVLVDPHLSVSEGHYISQAVHERLVREVDEVQDVLVHVDPEDDEVTAPTRGLPTRRQVLEWLRPRWATVPGAQHISQITLHYLDGRVAVELALPLASVDGLDDARRLADALAASADGLDPVASVRTRFY